MSNKWIISLKLLIRTINQKLYWTDQIVLIYQHPYQTIKLNNLFKREIRINFRKEYSYRLLKSSKMWVKTHLKAITRNRMYSCWRTNSTNCRNPRYLITIVKQLLRSLIKVYHSWKTNPKVRIIVSLR